MNVALISTGPECWILKSESEACGVEIDSRYAKTSTDYANGRYTVHCHRLRANRHNCRGHDS